MPPTSNLFAIVHELLLDHATAQPLDVADDEATFVQQLRTSAQRASQASGYVANVCKPCTPEGDAVTLTEAHLPLFRWESGDAVTRDDVRRPLASAALRQGMPSELLNTHSLRAGGASAASTQATIWL